MESVLIDVTFAVLMAPVDAFNALLGLFDTTEYPSDSASINSKNKSFTIDSGRSLGSYWDKYMHTLAMLWRRVVAFHFSVVGYLMGFWTAVGDGTLWFYSCVEQSVTWVYSIVYSFIETTATVVNYTVSFISDLLVSMLVVDALLVFFISRFCTVLFLSALFPPLPLFCKGKHQQAWILCFLVCFFPYLWTVWAAYSFAVTLSTPGLPA